MISSPDPAFIPVQPKEEYHNLSAIVKQTLSNNENQPTDLSALSFPKIIANASLDNPKPLSEPQHQQHQQQQQHLRRSHDNLISATNQIKRKRGRPRKYTVGGFPSRITSPSHSRLSLPSIPSATSNSLISTNSTSIPRLEPSRKPRMGRPPKSSSNAAILNRVEIKHPTSNATASISGSVVTSDHLHEILPSKFHGVPTSSAFFPKIASYSHQTSSLINGHMNNGANGVTTNVSFSTQSLPISSLSMSVPPLRASAPVLMEYFNNTFVGGTLNGTTTTPIISASLPLTPCAGVEASLLGRLLPQAEAAVCAAKAAGLNGPHAWSPEIVGSFISTLPGCQHLASTFTDNEIDGPALLCLEQHDLMSVLKLKLGPAVKVFGAIRALRQALLSIPLTDFSADQASAFAAVVPCFPSLTFGSASQTSSLSLGSFSANKTDALTSSKPIAAAVHSCVFVNGVGQMNSMPGIDTSGQ